jgi:hypothetical protein
MTQSEQTPVQCRLANVPAGVKSSLAHLDFCAFEFPRCDGCPNISGSAQAFEAVDDPMKSAILSGWLHGDLGKPG